MINQVPSQVSAFQCPPCLSRQGLCELGLGCCVDLGRVIPVGCDFVQILQFAGILPTSISPPIHKPFVILRCGRSSAATFRFRTNTLRLVSAHTHTHALSPSGNKLHSDRFKNSTDLLGSFFRDIILRRRKK